MVPEQHFAEGDEVMHECFDEPVRKIRVHNSNDNGWAGRLEVSRNGGSWFLMECIRSCQGSSGGQGGSGLAVVDGDSVAVDGASGLCRVGWYNALLYCWGDLTCNESPRQTCDSWAEEKASVLAGNWEPFSERACPRGDKPKAAAFGYEGPQAWCKNADNGGCAEQCCMDMTCDERASKLDCLADNSDFSTRCRWPSGLERLNGDCNGKCFSQGFIPTGMDDPSCKDPPPGCFHFNAMVQEEHKGQIKMGDLEPLDSVLSWRADGTIGFEQLMVVAKDSTVSLPFQCIRTEADAAADECSMLVTRDHYLPVGPERALLLSQDVVAGMTIWVYNGQAMEEKNVHSNGIVDEAGIVSPYLLREGTVDMQHSIIVGGIAGSHFTVPMLRPLKLGFSHPVPAQIFWLADKTLDGLRGFARKGPQSSGYQFLEAVSQDGMHASMTAVSEQVADIIAPCLGSVSSACGTEGVKEKAVDVAAAIEAIPGMGSQLRAAAQEQAPVQSTLASMTGNGITTLDVIAHSVVDVSDTVAASSMTLPAGVWSLPTNAPTGSPTTQAPTESPTTKTPTESPTTNAPTESPTTKAPTESPTTRTATESPTTNAPTDRAWEFPRVTIFIPAYGVPDDQGSDGVTYSPADGIPDYVAHYKADLVRSSDFPRIPSRTCAWELTSRGEAQQIAVSWCDGHCYAQGTTLLSQACDPTSAGHVCLWTCRPGGMAATVPPTASPQGCAVDSISGCQQSWCTIAHWASQCQTTCCTGSPATPTPTATGTRVAPARSAVCPLQRKKPLNARHEPQGGGSVPEGVGRQKFERCK
eukprot:gene6653-biopygen53245